MENKIKRSRFFLCGWCGQTMKRIRSPVNCKKCSSTDIGELNIKWKNR